MKERRTRTSTGQKQVIVASCLMLILVTCLTGLYIAGNMEQSEQDTQLAQNDTKDEQLSEEESAQPLEEVDAVLLPERQEEEKEAKQEKSEPEEVSDPAAQEKSVQEAASVGGAAVTVEQAAPELKFCGELQWPVEGNVLMNYSMDQSIYFETLDQYKYNPAMIIDAQVGDAVKAAAGGTITEIRQDAQTGLTVCMDIGNGYELQYGQMQELNFKEGAHLDAGDELGKVAAASKYYSLEGDNLYFALTKDQVPADPSEFLPQ